MRVAQTEFEFDHLLCNESEVSVVPRPHLFSYLFYFGNKRKYENKCTNISNNIFIQLSKGYAHYMMEIKNDWNVKLKMIKMRLIIVAGAA